MIRKLKKIALLVGVSVLCYSCAGWGKNKPSELNYMQNVEEIATTVAKDYALGRLKPGDQLVINVLAKDLDVVKPFNQNYSSGEIIQTSQVSGNKPMQGQVTNVGPTYVVDSEGGFDFPVLGRIEVEGKNTEEIKADLQSRLRRYIINPLVTVKHTNFRVSVLGEVQRPGEYVISDGNATLLRALSMAGDLTMYGNRNDVLIIRSNGETVEKARINLKDAAFIASPYYHLQQGDVIYVSANLTRERAARLDPNAGIYISIASVALGLITIFVTTFK
ncbi:polysaccharide biosynthesis/export family protein [Bergeyella sp. RCAD1439]|uniref:polysaccharide biosynthesis/export family protein n=1 Tax=Bergeyella anatis TaxID=3113737 RepID=UPI002E19146E|nr:polysaccharide biosynthesis/export family protein [Bergeyella sp. RCAD1439]